jgi:hypothetical protein
VVGLTQVEQRLHFVWLGRGRGHGRRTLGGLFKILEPMVNRIMQSDLAFCEDCDQMVFLGYSPEEAAEAGQECDLDPESLHRVLVSPMTHSKER